MKKLLSVALCLVFLLSFSACGSGEAPSQESSEPTSASEPEYQTYSKNSVYFEVPGSWEKTVNEDIGMVYYYPLNDSGSPFLMVQDQKLELDTSIVEDNTSYSAIIDGLKQSSQSFTVSDGRVESTAKKIPYRYLSAAMEVNDISSKVEGAFFDRPGGIIVLWMFVPDGSENTYSEDFVEILNSVTIAGAKKDEGTSSEDDSSVSNNGGSSSSTPSNNGSSSTQQPESQAPVVPAPSTPNGGNSQQSQPQSPASSPNSSPTPSQSSPVQNTQTAGQKNALRKAKEYLNVLAFSYEGLIGQLEYEGYTHEDAVYGADNCGANWNEQALKKAKNYLNTMPMSYNGLIKQLEYEKFTKAQATYGADNCKANWKEQAAAKAKDYLDLMSFSRERLISQLEYDGFTHEQAVYGAEANGY